MADGEEGKDESRVYFEDSLTDDKLETLQYENLLSWRHYELFLSALQVMADLVAMGTGGLRGSFFLYFILNAGFIVSAIAGFYGALVNH